jgi:hypothetical protein
MSEEHVFERGEVGHKGDDPAVALVSHVEARFAEAYEQVRLELAAAPAPNWWEIYAWGPFGPAGAFPAPNFFDPGRIIFLGEVAYIVTLVFMNPQMCADVQGFEGKIELSYWTSNTQTMRPVPSMDYTCCIETSPNDPSCTYATVWEFEPPEAACLLETNICARICNCNNRPVPGYAGFVRHVWDFDPDKLFFGTADTPPGWTHRPIKYMVSDGSDCDCTQLCVPYT